MGERESLAWCAGGPSSGSAWEEGAVSSARDVNGRFGEDPEEDQLPSGKT